MFIDVCDATIHEAIIFIRVLRGYEEIWLVYCLLALPLNSRGPAVGNMDNSRFPTADNFSSENAKIKSADRLTSVTVRKCVRTKPWEELPTWYGVTENDRIVPPEAQHMFADQINATVLSINSSHASPLSHPNEVAQLILDATRSE